MYSLIVVLISIVIFMILFKLIEIVIILAFKLLLQSMT